MARKNNLPPEWVRVARRHRERVPAGSPFSAFERAMREASAEYHGRPVASNPGAGGLVKLAIIAGAVWIGYNALVKPSRTQG